uniref:SCP domain-containing protein n=1 Tax=Haemonchus contortus TaxID=6289 RepID=A0A7I4YJ60_HAECO
MLVRILLLFFSTIFVHNAAASSSDCTCSTAESSSKNTDVTTSSPTTRSMSSYSTVTTTATTSTYSTVNPDNTICPHLHIMDDMTRNKSITAHNFRRSRLAQGMVKNKNGKNLPPASNMLKLLYHCHLEFGAFESARRCSLSPLSGLRPGVQENIDLITKSEAQNPQGAIIEAIKHWWSPVRKDGGVGQGVTYTAYNEGKPISWFTRMAWATTKYLGCAVHSCGNSQWSVVCHYFGNNVSEHIYEKGTPCTACPTGYFCDSEKLCAPNITAK